MPKLNKSAPKAAKKKRMQDEMHKFKAGDLHSGSKDGPKVKSREQAIAIGLSESGQSKKKVNSAKKTRSASNRRPRNRGRS